MNDIITWDDVKRAADVLQANKIPSHNSEWYMLLSPEYIAEARTYERRRNSYLLRYTRRGVRMKKGIK